MLFTLLFTSLLEAGNIWWCSVFLFLVTFCVRQSGYRFSSNVQEALCSQHQSQENKFSFSKWKEGEHLGFKLLLLLLSSLCTKRIQILLHTRKFIIHSYKIYGKIVFSYVEFGCIYLLLLPILFSFDGIHILHTHTLHTCTLFAMRSLHLAICLVKVFMCTTFLAAFSMRSRVQMRLEVRGTRYGA